MIIAPPGNNPINNPRNSDGACCVGSMCIGALTEEYCESLEIHGVMGEWHLDESCEDGFDCSAEPWWYSCLGVTDCPTCQALAEAYTNTQGVCSSDPCHSDGSCSNFDEKGSCCLDDEGSSESDHCSYLSQVVCEEKGGVWGGPGTCCDIPVDYASNNNLEQGEWCYNSVANDHYDPVWKTPTRCLGACCSVGEDDGDSCYNTTSSNCQSEIDVDKLILRHFWGVGNYCGDSITDNDGNNITVNCVGPCCTYSFSCIVTNMYDCHDQFGYTNIDKLGHIDPCVDEDVCLGSCCLKDPEDVYCIDNVHISKCKNVCDDDCYGSTFNGFGSLCNDPDNDCIGACCLTGTDCEMRSAEGCNDGTFYTGYCCGDDGCDNPVDCGGACCSSDNTCENDIGKGGCEGYFHGDGTVCPGPDDNFCSQTGACCDIQECLEDMTIGQCYDTLDDAASFFAGEGCNPNPCLEPIGNPPPRSRSNTNSLSSNTQRRSHIKNTIIDPEIDNYNYLNIITGINDVLDIKRVRNVQLPNGECVWMDCAEEKCPYPNCST